MCILNETSKVINSENQNNGLFTSGLFATGADINPEMFINQVCGSLPLVLFEGNFTRYILIADIPKELNDWIFADRTKTATFQVLSKGEQKELKAICRRLKLKYKRGWQKIKYMGHTAEIEYPIIRDPNTKMSVALIPWFMLPRKKFPVFIYLYADWCCRSQNTSEREAAAAVEQLFKTGIHYSVVSRSLNMVDNLLNIEVQIPTSLPEAVAIGDIIKNISSYLTTAINQEQPQPSGGCPAVTVMQRITVRFAKIVRPKSSRPRKAKPPAPAPMRKKQTAEPCFKDKKKKPKPEPFIKDKRVRRARQLFIILCRRFVLNAAILYHKFLI
jgi:hypothetical protein